MRYFLFADSIAQRIGFLDIFRRQTGLSQIAVHETQTGVGYCEIRIKFESAFVERNRRRVSLLALGRYAHTEGLQCLQRRSCRLNRNVEFLDGSERFAESAP